MPTAILPMNVQRVKSLHWTNDGRRRRVAPALRLGGLGSRGHRQGRNSTQKTARLIPRTQGIARRSSPVDIEVDYIRITDASRRTRRGQLRREAAFRHCGADRPVCKLLKCLIEVAASNGRSSGAAQTLMFFAPSKSCSDLETVPGFHRGACQQRKSLGCGLASHQ